VLLKPASPPLYLLDGKKGDSKVDVIAYTKNQLLVLNDSDLVILKRLPINK
jgi:hypothetical protein